jgi:hypothetical protein
MLAGSGRGSAILDRLERDALFVAALGLSFAALLASVPSRFNQDGWLALVAGREGADRGIPHHDRLAVLTHGVSWIDQQWLSQLAVYQVERVGGLALYCTLYVGLVVGAIGLACLAARRLGAADLHILAVVQIPAIIFAAAAAEVRTQGFAYPLFVAVLWLLVAESRSPSRRGYLLFPLLVLWANVHGSVTLGVGLGMIYGFTQLVGRPAAGASGRPWRRGVIFLVASPLCLLATPYGVDAIAYYQDTLLNATFRRVIEEWAPVTSQTLLAVPFFAVAFGAIWLLGRSRGTHALFEHLVLYAMIAAGIGAIRNVAWLGLAAIVLLPGLVGTAFGPPTGNPRRRVLNLSLAGGASAVVLVTLIAVLAQPDSWFERGYGRGAATVVAAAARADSDLRVNAGDHYTDWLLWHEPQLVGRVAYDARLELLTEQQLDQVTSYQFGNGDQGAIASGFGLLVLDPIRQPSATQARVREAGATVLFRSPEAVVVKRPQR